MSTVLPLDTDYTPRDYYACEQRLQDLQESVFPNITDKDTINLLNLLRKYIAWQCDRNDLYIHNMHREMFVPTMETRKSAILHGRRQGYALQGAAAATADLSVTLENAPLPGTVTFAVGDIVKTSEVSNPVIGEVQAVATIPPGSSTATLSWEHSRSKSTSVTADGRTPDLEFELPEGPYLDGSAYFSTLAGLWSEVDTFLYSGPTDRHFRVLVDQNDKATVVCGDGQLGAIPSGTFDIYYKTGGGSSGEVEPDSLRTFGKSYTDSLGNQALLTVTNAAKASGGTDRETVASAKINIPAHRRLPVGTIAREDFEIRALGISGVARALMLTSDEDASIPENEGRLYIVPVGGGATSSALLASVNALFVNYPPPVTFPAEPAVAADYLTVNVQATIWLSEGAGASAVKAAAETAYEQWFSPLVIDTDSDDYGAPNPNVDFGWNYKDADGDPAGEVPWSDLLNVLRDLSGVRKIDAGVNGFLLNGIRDDVVVSNHKFPAFGTLTLYNGATGLQI